MDNIPNDSLQRQVTHPYTKESRSLAPLRRKNHLLSGLRHIPTAEQSWQVATDVQDSPFTIDSNSTFDTFRANGGQSRFFQFAQGEAEQHHVQRQPSIISSLPLPSPAPAELVCLLGDKHGKLKAGATVGPRDQKGRSYTRADNSTPQKPVNTTALERAKPKPRVQLNLRLAGDTFVQGQAISGQLIVYVRSTKFPVRLANNKLRVIGFECLTDGPNFHVFFHHSCQFDEISYAGEQIFSESPDYSDEEGYREAREGIHVLPFEMTLPDDSSCGKPKGVVDVRGAAMRYIVMASVNIKDPDTNQLSLAHFYRTCSIWPSLSIHGVLVPSTRPLVSTAVMTLYRGGSRNKLKLSARVPRPSYFAGQRCYVHVQIMNDTWRTVRSLRLNLIRTTTVYRPQSGKETRREDHDSDGHVSNNYQSKAFVDEISESRLVMAEPTTRRCASSKGWWAGVNPQERTAFTHSILIPPDTLSVARTELLAVDHAIRVTVYASAGTLGLTSHLSVILPIRVLSMISVDPPTSVSRPPNMLTVTNTNRPDVVNGHCLHLPPSDAENHVDLPPSYRTRPSSLEHPQDIPEILPNYQPTRSSWSNTPSVESQTREYPFDETPRMIDVLSFQGANQQLPEQVIAEHFPRVAREEPSFRHRAGIRSSLFKEEDRTSIECHAGGSTASRNSTTHRARPPSNAHQSGPGSYIVSPVPSLFRARARALTITNTSGLSRLRRTDGDRNQGVHGDYSNGNGRRYFRSYESPFSRRVKEKLREVRVSDSEASRQPSNQAVDLFASDEDADRYGSPEILECPSHPQGSSNIRDVASSPASCTKLPVIKPLRVRTAKPRLLMGPRNPNVATSPGSVMDKVRMIEGRDLAG